MSLDGSFLSYLIYMRTSVSFTAVTISYQLHLNRHACVVLVISGPKNLQVAKTSTTSVIVQWEEAQGEIDRYILSIRPNQSDGSGKGSQEMRVPPGRDSAQIDGLEPGRLYDLSLVAEKDGTRSLPATVQATPGER